GLHVHVNNETAQDFIGSVELMLLKDDQIIVARKEATCALPSRSLRIFESDALLEGFYDAAYAYRFVPAKHDVAIATLLDRERQVVSEAFHFVQRRDPVFLSSAALECVTVACGQGKYQVRMKADRFLRNVFFDARGFLPSDNYFHLIPGRERI